MLLARCLESIARHGCAIPFETIVVLNDAVAEVEDLVRLRVSGVTVLESTVPLGFAGGANRGRASARAELLVLFHDDSEAEAGWLEGLVAAADANPEAGAVGSRMLHPDGSPQRMGAVLWGNGSTSQLGSREDSPLPTDEPPSAVDYCGSASLLIRAATWDAIGGAEERFFPAYYVDVDLCLGVWTFGQAVLCAAASHVRHHRGSSTEQRFRSFAAERNRALFLEKWGEMLLPFEPPAADNAEALRRAVKRSQTRWREAREAATVNSARPTHLGLSRPPFDAPAQDRRMLEIALDLQCAWADELKGLLDLKDAQADKLNAQITAMETSRWWRLRGHLLPIIRFVRWVSGRAAPNRTQ